MASMDDGEDYLEVPEGNDEVIRALLEDSDEDSWGESESDSHSERKSHCFLL